MGANRAVTPGSAATSGVVPYCQMTASNSSSVWGSAASAGPTAVAQRRVTPSASREIPMAKRGITRYPSMAPTKGSAPRATGPDPGQRTASSHGIASRAAAASVAATSCAVPQPTSVNPGRSKSTVGLPSNCRASGPYSSGTVRGVEHRRHGMPVRVATTSWLRPPARGRMPTPENPASSSIRRRTGAGGR